VAHYDAMVACWDAKYVYWAIRPFQLDPTLATLFATPNHPSYPAAHATNSTAIADVMSYLFPTRSATFRSMAGEAGRSRMVAGIHFQSDIDAGNTLGHKIAQAVIDWANQDGSDK
jgi:membrane-associated phospholipid phosphatase